MALLNKGVKLTADQTIIKLNNRLFEPATGAAFLTVRPDPASANGNVVLLSPGSTTAGHLRVSIEHVNAGFANAGYYFVIETLGTQLQTINTLQSALLSYGNEVTLGLSYDAANAKLNYAISGRSLVDTPTNLNAFSNGVTVTTSGLGATPTDSLLSIGADKYNGFISKLATYSAMMSNADLLKYVDDPANLPTKDRVIYLDATQLASVARIDNSVGEVQKLTFGPALSSGVISIDGLSTLNGGANGAKIAVSAGDSGAVIAEKVRSALADSALFKPQLEKQLITFSANTAGTSIKVAGVSVSILANDTAILIAGKVKTALEASTFITTASTYGRSIQDNGDGSLLITFASSDGDAKPIAIDSLSTTVKASVDTLQTYNASGVGRSVSTDGASVLIGLNRADQDIKDLYVNAGSTGITITKPTTTADHNNEFTGFIPSGFTFTGTPVGEIQRYIVTKPADANGETITFAGGIANTTVTFAAGTYTTTQTAAQIATDLKAAGLTNVLDVVANGDSVDIKFSPDAGNVADVTESTTGTSDGLFVVAQRYAQNLPGEAQTVTFTKATTAGNITVDGVTVAVAANDSASTVATKVQKALIDDRTLGNYSTPEIQMLTFLTGASGTGNITIGSATVAATTGDSPSALATAAVTALNAVASKNYTAVADGDSVKLTYYNSARDAATMTGVATNTYGVTATSFTTVQEFNANGKRATRINSDGTLTIEFGTDEGTLGDVAPIIFTDTGTTSATASVATTRLAQSLQLSSSGYTGGNVSNTGNAVASDVLYTQLVSSDAPSGNAKPLVFDVYVNSLVTAQNKVGTGYESVGFTLNYPSSDVTSSKVRIDMANSSSSPVINLNTAGQIVARWVNSTPITDFTKPIARVTMEQAGSAGSFKDALDFSFTNVDIDGVDFTDGTTFTRSFADNLLTERWDVKQKLVNGLDGTTPIGGQLVGYYGNPTVTTPQISLKYASLADKATTPTAPSLTNPDKTLSMNVVSAVAAVKSAKFAIELPANASNFKFTLSPEAAAVWTTSSNLTQSTKGHTLYVELTGGAGNGLAQNASIGTVSVDLGAAKDITHEFSFSGAPTLNSSAATPQGMYFGYTATEASTVNTLTGLNKGEWVAKDMPKGSFNKFFVATAPTNAAKVITAADALQILKLSAGYGLDWQSGDVPVGTYAAADIDGSGKITAADALIALKYASNTLPPDSVAWKFYDSTTSNLGVDNATLSTSLKADMTVASGGNVEITASNTQKDFFVQAILVGNVTNPALEV